LPVTLPWVQGFSYNNQPYAITAEESFALIIFCFQMKLFSFSLEIQPAKG
jgi:hypothetical protein